MSQMLYTPVSTYLASFKPVPPASMTTTLGTSQIIASTIEGFAARATALDARYNALGV